MESRFPRMGGVVGCARSECLLRRGRPFRQRRKAAVELPPPHCLVHVAAGAQQRVGLGEGLRGEFVEGYSRIVRQRDDEFLPVCAPSSSTCR